MYRGMHFMSDVVAGMILGAVSVVVTLLILTPAERARRARALPSVQRVADTEHRSRACRSPFWRNLMTYLAVIANTKKLEPGDRKRLNAAIEDAPFAKVEWLMIQKGSAAKQAAAKAVDNGADIVLVCGGDGSVRAAAEALVGTDTALAVMPSRHGQPVRQRDVDPGGHDRDAVAARLPARRARSTPVAATA